MLSLASGRRPGAEFELKLSDVGAYAEQPLTRDSWSRKAGWLVRGLGARVLAFTILRDT